MHRALRLALPIALAALATGCALFPNDRCYVPHEQYLTARDMFVQTGSLDIVERRLEEFQWRRCKINEILYRLEKEFQALPEEIVVEPTPTPQPLTIPIRRRP
jgi:hypothetical protein